MVMYDYQCQACGHTFEERLPSEQRHEPEQRPCPVCGAMNVKRIYASAPAFSDPAKLGVQKPDREFRDLLGKIKKDHYGGGNIDRYT